MIYSYPVTNFNLHQIANSGQCFRWKPLDKGMYEIPVFDQILQVYQNDGELVVETSIPETSVKYYFDLSTNYAEIIEAIPENDTYLQAASKEFSGVRILRQNLWEMVVSFIISQNNNIPRIKKSIEAICSYTNGIFPQQFEMPSVKLENCGLGYRQKYVENLNGKDYIPPVSSDYRDALEFYQSFIGIGPKVANCICLYGLHYLEACPIDTWMKRIIDTKYNGTTPVWMYSKYAGVYQQYCFCYERYLSGRDK